ncbi:class A beta-lactamase, subclass A2 [Pedobacter sp. MC2016-24]|uniref:class A beta-lactamase, subclass A2 n=1 Tax=Pedobacter sp. MC2016-24 TaxID=2780090 RepID=UPI0018812AA8|nr:class A beta-lactamase, subclass A2 [Pedobacter sp. MC2016-24]MBE9598313.1 class A beta-lactamase, subclass A2 [Pedobacter sp. MC2016-24]
MKNFKIPGQISIVICLLLIATNGFGQKGQPDLKKTIEIIAGKHDAKIGFAVLDLQHGDTVGFNGKVHYPMQSVYKFHLALAVLKKVDEGKLKLNQQLWVTPKDLLPNTWSPLREKYPLGNVSVSLAEILSYTVSQSDNNGCDILFRLLGGPAKVNQFIHRIGIKDVAILATEEEMHLDEQVQFKNSSTPFSTVQLLKLFYDKKILSESSGDFLWDIMVKASSGPNKIKGLLPKGTIVAHKTGSSGANAAGITAASNDIGVVTLPNGKHFAIAVFVSMTKESEQVTDRIIAECSKAAWDYLLGNKS